MRLVTAQHPWFTIFEDHDIYAMHEPYHSERVISYLVLGEARAILVDTGIGIGDIRREVEALSRHLPLSVVLSHAHSDHVGGARQFAEIAIFGDPEELELLRRVYPPEFYARYVGEAQFQLGAPMPATFHRETFTLPPLTPTRLLHEGDILDLGGRTLEVIHTPGHTSGSICLLCRDCRVLLTADFFYPGRLHAHAPGTNFAAYQASITKLQAFASQVDVVYTAHNRPDIACHRGGRHLFDELADAFEQIRQGKLPYEFEPSPLVPGKVRRYYFTDYSVLVRDDDPHLQR